MLGLLLQSGEGLHTTCFDRFPPVWYCLEAIFIWLYF